MTVRTLCWLKTRSTATTSGRCSSSHALDAVGRRASSRRSSAIVRRGAHDADATQRDRPAGRHVDHADAAAGQPGIDAEHPHGLSHPASCEHPFGRPNPSVARAALPTHRSAADSSTVVELGQDLVGDVEVGVDVLHVVAVLERVDQPNTLRAPSASSVDARTTGTKLASAES